MSGEHCPSCGCSDMDVIHAGVAACSHCGLVHSGTMFQDAGPTGVSDGWQVRALNLSPMHPKNAIDAGLVSVDELARLLTLGPLYIETPNTREPSLSLRHFFHNRSPVYYEPATLAVALAMAGADDIELDEVAGMITCVATGGGERMTYEAAVAQTGVEIPTGVAARMLAHFAPKPPEVAGDVVPGACFLCGGTRRTWRSVTICDSCSALTTQTHGPLLEQLTTEISTADGRPVQFFAPDMRSTSPAECEMVASTKSVMLDESGWAHALVMSGADMVRVNKHAGAMQVQGTALGAARKKTYAEACELVVKLPAREARHTLAVWNTPIDQPSRYELWIAGDDEDDAEMLRAEAKRDRFLASSAVEALRVLMQTIEAKQDDPDDWHADPYLNGFRMGASSAWRAAQSAVSSAWMAVVQRTVRDE